MAREYFLSVIRIEKYYFIIFREFLFVIMLGSLIYSWCAFAWRTSLQQPPANVNIRCKYGHYSKIAREFCFVILSEWSFKFPAARQLQNELMEIYLRMILWGLLLHSTIILGPCVQCARCNSRFRFQQESCWNSGLVTANFAFQLWLRSHTRGWFSTPSLRFLGLFLQLLVLFQFII